MSGLTPPVRWMWPWHRLPTDVLLGLRSSDSEILAPLCSWLHAQVAHDQNYNDDSDLAQELCIEIQRMMGSLNGRNTLSTARNLPKLLETVTKRLRAHRRRAEVRYDAAVRRVTDRRHVETPFEVLDGAEVTAQLFRLMDRLTDAARRILALHLGGMSNAEVGASLWPDRCRAQATQSVKASLVRSRRYLQGQMSDDGHRAPALTNKLRSFASGTKLPPPLRPMGHAAVAKLSPKRQ